MKLIHIVGCRPNFIKLAPVWKAAENKCEQIIIHTGQHYDEEMSQVFFDELELPQPHENLGIGSASPCEQIGEMVIDLETWLNNFKSTESIVVVYGDTNSTLAGALAAKKMKFKIAHVEAGLRCYDWNMPEEVNRRIVDHISDFLFCPSDNAIENLRREGLYNDPVSIFNYGDVTYDTFLWAQDKLESKESISYVLATIHREENVEPERFEKIENIISNLNGLIFWPRHPRTGNGSPVSYLKMLSKIRDAKFVITDSAGVQKEAFWFGVPCITVRKSTEWKETIEAGWNRLAEPELIVDKMISSWPISKLEQNPYGCGTAAQKIISCLLGEIN